MTEFAVRAARNLEALRAAQPLVHNITNFVVMNFTANALLAMGASPVMAHAAGEVEEMVALAGALVLNIGTLTEEWVESMIRAGRTAAARGTPIVLDPVGAGATRLRTASALRIVAEVHPGDPGQPVRNPGAGKHVRDDQGGGLHPAGRPGRRARRAAGRGPRGDRWPSPVRSTSSPTARARCGCTTATR